ncbi:hypothetical protein T440DRAFT_64460 [Plenodomus tracheiphilus IPT5]|uniref:Uncharacterized protein n=1 Tax=Plenodomus tracheiphilus IPT5 TaxID=1408161 RepID=A0A6A7B8C1_9PLEO|nr:hypothetical protein T440DRAFT_64460 [Plenodomus tracheiphilus IPT5]
MTYRVTCRPNRGDGIPAQQGDGPTPQPYGGPGRTMPWWHGRMHSWTHGLMDSWTHSSLRPAPVLPALHVVTAGTGGRCAPPLRRRLRRLHTQHLELGSAPRPCQTLGMLEAALLKLQTTPGQHPSLLHREPSDAASEHRQPRRCLNKWTWTWTWTASSSLWLHPSCARLPCWSRSRRRSG